jgi:hypothetical protein
MKNNELKKELYWLTDRQLKWFEWQRRPADKGAWQRYGPFRDPKENFPVKGWK